MFCCVWRLVCSGSLGLLDIYVVFPDSQVYHRIITTPELRWSVRVIMYHKVCVFHIGKHVRVQTDCNSYYAWSTGIILLALYPLLKKVLKLQWDWTVYIGTHSWFNCLSHILNRSNKRLVLKASVGINRFFVCRY